MDGDPENQAISSQAMALLPLVLAFTLVAAPGGWGSSQGFATGTKIFRLAEFSLASLQESCATSNSGKVWCDNLSGVTISSVTAEAQVVAGKKYKIHAMTSAGDLTLQVWEKAWANQLTLTSATLTKHSTGFSFAMVITDLLEGVDQMSLDAARFATLLEQDVQPAAHECSGGKIWKECGSPCVKTCEMPAPMCMAMCQPRCECPKEKPIWKVNPEL